MRRDKLAPLAVLAGLALAGLSAIAWHDGPADSSAGPTPTASSSPTSPTQTESTLRIDDKPSKPRHTPDKTTKAPEGPELKTGEPERLDLPSIGVSAAVSPIGTDGSRTLVPPSDYTTVGWWALGAEPGDGAGTTIVAGHTVHTGGGALDNLANVEIGDSVRLERADQDLRYRVTSVTTYRKGTLAANAAEVFDQTGPERLAIVTCADWNGKIYLSNTVVIASNPRPVPSVG
jgi:LPXTG-site transpeptidase (sortase) family protein